MGKAFKFIVLALAGAACSPALAQTAAPPASTASRPPAAAASTFAARYAVEALEKVCLPVLRGAPLKASAQSADFKLENGAWVLPIGGGQQITLQPPTGDNPHLCGMTILSSVGGGASMRAILSAWAADQTPPLAAVRKDASVVGPSHERLTSTWAAQTASGVEGVVLSQERTLQGKPVDGAFNQSNLLVSLTPA